MLLALSPIVEQRIAPLLFGEQAAVTVAASLVELAALDRTLADSDGESEALLVSADLPDLTPSLLSRARSHGLRLVGIATDEHDAALLRELPLDAILTCPIDALDAAGRRSRQRRESQRRRRSDWRPATPTHDARAVNGEGTVLAVVGSRGAPGASELACSLAALASADWRALLVELDLLGDAGLALRLGSRPEPGLAARAAARNRRPASPPWRAARALARHPQPAGRRCCSHPPEPEQVIDELDQPGAIRAGLDALADAVPARGRRRRLPARAAGRHRPGRALPPRSARSPPTRSFLCSARARRNSTPGLAQLDLLLDELGIPRERMRVVCNGVGGPGAIPRPQLEQTLTIGAARARTRRRRLVPWDARALAKRSHRAAARAAHPRGGYARALRRLLDTLFLPGAPVARGRKRLLDPAARERRSQPEPSASREDEEVALPWRS